MMMRLFQMKVHEADHARWKEAAYQERISLSEWVRRRCNGDVFIQPVQKQAEANTEVIQNLLHEQVVKVSRKDCLNRLPAGTYCKQCGRSH